ncbi:MAG: GGDEF domain-containing protein [Aquificaceae bacterium]
MYNTGLKSLVKREFLERIKIKPHYQPIVDLSSGDIHGYEALSRFELDGKNFSPLKIFSMAKDIDAASELDLMCRKVALENFPRDLKGKLFLNVYPSYLVSEYMGKGHTMSYVLESGFNPRSVVLELTEAEKVQDMRLLKGALSHYKDMGFHVGIDDIGTGFNSLEHLLNLEGLLDYVKLPRELINGVSRSKIRHSLIKVLTEVSLSIGARPIYEGLEKQEDLLVLCQDFDAHLFQGFYFSLPLSPEDLRNFKLEARLCLCSQDKGLHGVDLRILHVKGEEKFGSFLERVEEFQDRYTLLDMDGNLYLLDLWKLKSQLNHIKRNLYYYRNIREATGLMKEVFVSVENLPEVDTSNSNLRNLFDLVTSSDWEVFVLGKGNGALRVIEKHNLIDYLHRKLTKELLESTPLTQLPGNRSIEETIKRLGNSGYDFYVCYLDIDNFKAFNDAYGFYAGDQMIKKVGFLLKNFESENVGRVFVGHVGGDDFVLILWDTALEDVKGKLFELLKNLKANLLEFYSPEDIQRGYFMARSREEEIREFPLADVSMVLVKGSPDPLDISRRSAQLKKKAKSVRGSVLVVEGLNEILTIAV